MRSFNFFLVRPVFLLACFVLGWTLAGCASQPPAMTAFLAAESADTAALAALVAYKKLPNRNGAVVTKLLADQVQVDSLLSPLEADVAAGQTVTVPAALLAALATLTADEAANSIKP